MTAPDIKSTTDAGNGNQAPKQKRHDGFEYVTLITAIIGVVVLCIYTGLAGYQAAIARDTERRQLRAYLVITETRVDCGNCAKKNGQFVPPKNGLAETRNLVTIKNFGMTPAYKVHSCSGDTLVEPGTVLPSDFSYACKTPCGDCPAISIGPGAERLSLLPMPIEDLMMAGAGFKRLFYYGEIQFSDAFETKRVLPFCWFWDGGDSDETIDCDAHNTPEDD